MASGEKQPDELSQRQSAILDSFLARYVDKAETDPTSQAQMDQAQAHLKSALADFEIDISTPEKFYPFMIGLTLGTNWMARFILDLGITPNEAETRMQTLAATSYMEASK